MSLSTPHPPSILHLYTELLLHIHTVTLFASLRTEHTSQTKAELSADGKSIALTHEGERASIRLPTRIAGGGSATLTLPEAPTKDLTLRLQLQEKSPGLLKGGARSENVVPWDAARLAESERVACRECGTELVDVKNNINKWMDLPNENWAEMMDFWHCHKPHEHHLPGHKHDAATDKGYAASNRINAKKGVGYVDLTHLLLVEADCPGVQPSTSTSNLQCSTCKAMIGVVDPRAEGWRIWKWSITATPKGSIAQIYSIRKWLSAQLLYLIENQGVRKFTVTPDLSSDAATEDSILVWVFTPDLSFSSSITSGDRNNPTRALKVLWKLTPPSPSTATSAGAAQPVDGKAQGQVLDKHSLSVEELSLPEPAYSALREALRESGDWLPSSARKFQEWNVGLLERFEDSEV